MASTNIKMQILLLKAVDWIGLVGVLAWGVYATINAENRPLAALLALVGLAVVNQLGRWTFMKVAILKSKMRKQQHDELKKRTGY